MSILQETLSTSEEVTSDTLNSHLPQLTSKSIAIKSELLDYIEEVQLKYENRPKTIKAFLSEASKQLKAGELIRNDSNELLKNKITETKNAVGKHKKRLRSTGIHLAILKNLCTIHEGIKAIENDCDSESALKVIDRLEKFIDDIPNDEMIRQVEDLQAKLNSIKLNILNQFNDVIGDYFKTDITDCDVTISLNNDDRIKSTFHLLSKYYDNISPLDEFVRFLWDNVFCNVVHHKCAVDGDEVFKVIVNKSDKNVYTDVFDNLRKVSDFLYTNCNHEMHDGSTTVEYIGSNIRDNLNELIIKYCLEDTIPATSEGLQTYNEVISNTEKLQEHLVRTQIFGKESTSILDYANNVDILFINKKCKQYMNLGVSIMKKDLHDITTVGSPVDPLKLSNSDFAQCSISKSVPELLLLIEKIVLKATTSSEISSGRLYTTAKNILHQYGPVVSAHHQKLLQTIPQQIAIFQNNCMYMVHELDGDKWRQLHSKLPKTVGTDGNFADVQKKIQSVAFDMFQKYVNDQIKQMNETIKTAGIDAGPSCETLQPSAEKAVRQCLRQQELLKTVWQKVLNYYVYNKTMGDLLDSLCRSLCDSVVALEDIASEAAEQLVDIFKVVLTRGPKLFTEPKEINMYVFYWHKLSELVFVLNSGLDNIRDRWADGKGPLALQFTGEEMKRLIRALFQNTDRRAAVLANIASTYVP